LKNNLFFMEKPNLEAAFFEAKKDLQRSKQEMEEFLRRQELTDSDRVRLTRVLQLIERYQPERSEGPSQPTAWLNLLESLYRLMPSRSVSTPEASAPLDKPSSRSFLSAEEAIKKLRELRHLDSRLLHDDAFEEDRVLNQDRSRKVTKQELVETSLTLDYQKKHWGMERICLDGIQNHLPSDSKGQHVWVQCMVGGKWVSLLEARKTPEKIEQARFIDDGVGFEAG